MSETLGPASIPMDPSQRRQVRRTALVLGLLAVAIYVGFILYSILRASH